MHSDHQYENLIARYLNGDCTEQEYKELLDWAVEDPANRKTFIEIKDTWDAIPGRDLSIEQQLVSFYRDQLEKRAKPWISYWKQAVAIAAVLAIGLFSGILITQQKGGASSSQTLFEVPLGSRSAMTLADGSRVKLNSGSELTWLADEKTSDREVRLSGEAFFEVNSDPGTPFIVHTDDFTVEVTGTSFNICTYGDNPFSSATLAEGSISLQFAGSDKKIDMKPGDNLRYDREKRTYRIAAADVESEIAWKDGEFIFRNIAFSELVKRLERWYDVKISFAGNDLNSFTYTGRFKNQETIWQVLDALKLTTPIDYRRITFREFEITYRPS
jgi:ferric-dicitrate binding protein FerR (iron transport regulator)